MASKPREILIDLERDGPHTPWGIRLVGGSDLNTPLIITKVLYFNHFLKKKETKKQKSICDTSVLSASI